MAKLSVGQKATRLLIFLFAFRNGRIMAIMKRFGFTQTQLDEGWDLLRRASRTKLAAGPSTPLEPGLLQSMDEWENLWLAVAFATLERHFPAIHAWFFRNLRNAEGLEVIISVGTFVERYDLLDKPEKDGGPGAGGKEAKKLLAERGLTKAVIEEARAMLKKAGQVQGAVPDLEKLAEDEQVTADDEKAMWAYYLEWSKIARKVIKQRALLRQLGFLRVTASGKEEEVPEDEAEQEPATEPPVG